MFTSFIIYILIGMTVTILGSRSIFKAFIQLKINDPINRSILVAFLIVIWPIFLCMKVKNYWDKFHK